MIVIKYNLMHCPNPLPAHTKLNTSIATSPCSTLWWWFIFSITLAAANYMFVRDSAILSFLYVTLSNTESNLDYIGVVYIKSCFFRFKRHSNFRNDQSLCNFISRLLYNQWRIKSALQPNKTLWSYLNFSLSCFSYLIWCFIQYCFCSDGLGALNDLACAHKLVLGGGCVSSNRRRKIGNNYTCVICCPSSPRHPRTPSCTLGTNKGIGWDKVTVADSSSCGPPAMVRASSRSTDRSGGDSQRWRRLAAVAATRNGGEL